MEVRGVRALIIALVRLIKKKYMLSQHQKHRKNYRTMLKLFIIALKIKSDLTSAK